MVQLDNSARHHLQPERQCHRLGDAPTSLSVYEALREHEFKGILDKNKDGIADK